MTLGLSNRDATNFLERISATTIVNHACWRCTVAGLPITRDNVNLFIGDFANPSEPRAASLIRRVELVVRELIATKDLFERASNFLQ